MPNVHCEHLLNTAKCLQVWLLDRGLVQSGSDSGQPVVCASLTSCRKHFTTQVQVILRACLLKLEGVKQRKDLKVEATGERLGGPLFWLPRNVTGSQ